MTVVVVGSANADTTITVDHLPGPGETILARAVDRRGGGKGANVAHAAAASSAQVVFVATVGDDPDADLALAGLEDAGVILSHVRRGPTPTGTALILVDTSGENCIVVDLGANFAWDVDDALAVFDALPMADAVVVTNFEVPLPICRAVGEAAAATGARFVLNPSPLATVPPELLACRPWVVANAHEAASLAAMLGSPTQDPESAARAIQAVTRAPVVVTLGADGAGLLDEGWTLVPGRAVDVVDTTGAGDAFLGAFAATALSGSLRDAVGAGVAHASRVVQVSGARLPNA